MREGVRKEEKEQRKKRRREEEARKGDGSKGRGKVGRGIKEAGGRRKVGEEVTKEVEVGRKDKEEGGKYRLHILFPTALGAVLCWPPAGVFSFGGVAITVVVATGPSTPGERRGDT